MVDKCIAIFAGVTTALILSNLKWISPQPVIGATIRVSTPISYHVAPAVSGQKRQFHSEGFIPSNLEQSDNPHPGSRNIFGSDDRIPMDSPDYPWSSIGKLVAHIDANTVELCTGTLISQKLVITNAHCVFDEQGNPLKEITFYPNLINGKSKDSASITKVLYGTSKPKEEASKDWAILTLDQPLGKQYGWMSWMTLNLADLDSLREKFILAGYSHDFPKDHPGATAGVHQGCSIRGFESSQPNLISHDCDTTKGSSGGAIFTFYKGKPVIVALNNSERRLPGTTELTAKFAADTANYGVLADNWVEAASAMTAKAQ